MLRSQRTRKVYVAPQQVTVAPIWAQPRTTRPKSRRVRRRFRLRLLNQERRQKAAQARKEEVAIKNQEEQAIQAIENEIRLSFGFVADINKSDRHNAAIRLATMPTWWYFHRPVHMAFHDITTTIKPPANLRSLLGLGLKFVPTPRFTNSDLTETLSRFERNLLVKAWLADQEPADEDPDREPYDPKIYIPSGWTPNPWDVPRAIHRRLRRFRAAIEPLFAKRRGRPNLLPHQRRALVALMRQQALLVVQCDKNLGPAIIEVRTYVERVLNEHLLDAEIYSPLSASQAKLHQLTTAAKIEQWLKKHPDAISRAERKFLRHHLKNSTDFPIFYATIKIHKTPWKLRPIISCSGSLLYALGIWVDRQLQKVASKQRSYFKSAADLKHRLTTLRLPPGTKLFKSDAQAFYPSIKTGPALRAIAAYLRRHQRRYPDVHVEALIEALTIVMKNNVFKFGNTFWRQKSGAAMGTPPAPPYGTTFFAIHEESIYEEFESTLFFYVRYIDDVLGAWTPLASKPDDDRKWDEFKAKLNDFHGLEWITSDRSESIDYMDLLLTIKNNRIVTDLYEKSLNLYLYIPPHSAHPPGVLTGLILGQAHRIYTLCSEEADIKRHLRQFYQ